MADFTINIFMDDAKKAKVEAAGLADKIVAVGDQEAIQVTVTPKEKKKLVKGFPDLAFDDAGAGVLPEEADAKLCDIVCEMQTTDVMKFAIMKLYNPLAGKAPRAAQR